jgi:hypothetical protein
LCLSKAWEQFFKGHQIRAYVQNNLILLDVAQHKIEICGIFNVILSVCH